MPVIVHPVVEYSWVPLHDFIFQIRVELLLFVNEIHHFCKFGELIDLCFDELLVLEVSFECLLENEESFVVVQLLLILFVQSDLLVIPMQLVNHVLVAHSHAANLANSSLLLVNILVHEIDQFLVQKAILVSVLEKHVKKRALLIEFKVEPVNHNFEHFFKVFGQKLL